MCALAGCVAPDEVALPDGVGDGPWALELPGAISVGTRLVSLEPDATLFTFGAEDSAALPRPGVYPSGDTRACPLPTPRAAYTLETDGTWIASAPREVGWFEDPATTPSAWDITSTCGALASPWALDASACAARVRVDDPSWADAELGLLPAGTPRRLRARDPARRCEPIDAEAPAIGALECTGAEGLCHVDVFDASAPLVVEASTPLAPVLGSVSRSRRPLDEPFVKQLHGLALADDLVWVATTTEAGGLRGCDTRSTLVGLERGGLAIARRWPLTGPYRCALDVTRVDGVDGLLVLARRASGDGPPIDCTAPGIEPHRGGDWAALVFDVRTGRVSVSVPLGQPCARRAFVAAGPSPREVLVALVDTTTSEEPGRQAATLLRVDLARGLASAPLQLGVEGNATRAFDLAALVSTGPNRWLAVERGEGTARVVAVDGPGLRTDGAPPWRPAVEGRPAPAALTRLDDASLLGLLAGNRETPGLLLSLRVGAERYDVARWFPSSRGNDDAVAALDGWPERRGTIAVATVERDGPRDAWLELVDRPAGELRLRRRAERVRLGNGAVGPRLVVDRDGNLFAVLTWAAQVVRVRPPR